MARFVINNKLYDTEKMRHVANVRKWYELDGWLDQALFGKGMGRMHDCKMYRSEKGNFLLVRQGDYNTLIGEAITETEAKSLLMQYDLPAYTSLYGAIEEA